MAVILIVDDERAARFGMKKALSRANYQIHEAEDGEKAWGMLADISPDIVFLDLNMPRCNGMELLTRLKQMSCSPLVIVVTAHGSEKIAVNAMKEGAYDYLAKPYEVDELRLITEHALEKISLKRENKRLQEEIRAKERYGKIVGESLQMRKVYELVEKIANTDVTVLIDGESGTGKELVAKEIYQRSNRVGKSFIAMNCAALPENLIESELFGHEKGAFTGAGEQRKGKIEQADGGTLFLDEIGDMTLNTQAKVLRVLQDSTFQRLGGNKDIVADVRFIAATNKNLLGEIEIGNFREDLYYRIQVVDIHLPPLRDRITDIPILARHFLEIFAHKHRKNIREISDEALKKMAAFRWPGNVRQLQNIIEKSVLLSAGKALTLDDLPSEIVQMSGPGKAEWGISQMLAITENMSFKEAKKTYVQEFETQFITGKLKAHNCNISQTAQALEMPRQSLQQKLKELGINAREIISE